jgi:hypothetical protein
MVIFLGLGLIASSVVASQYFDKDPVTSLTFFATDGNCDGALHAGIGVHCFGDYTLLPPYTARANPWEEFNNFRVNYSAAGLLPHWAFGALGTALGRPNVGLYGYLALLVVAVVSPALWATRAKPIATRFITMGAFGLLSIPALMAIDRGNSVALAIPALLAFLVSLRRGNDRLAVVSIVLACLVKPHYVLLVLVLAAARKWRMSFISVAAIAVTNVLAFLVWPKAFPGSIRLAAMNIVDYASDVHLQDRYPTNVSLSKGLYLVESLGYWITGKNHDTSWVDRHSGILGISTTALVIVAIVVMGRRLPPILAGIIVMVCASLFPSISWSYYLVFALPVAAVLLRDPLGTPPSDGWRGILDEYAASRGKTIASVLVVLATAMTVSRVLLPLAIPVPQTSQTNLLATTGEVAPLLWLVAVVAVIVAWWLPGPSRHAARPGVPPLRTESQESLKA